MTEQQKQETGFEIEEFVTELGLKDLAIIQLKRQIKQLTNEVRELQSALMEKPND